MKETQRQKKVGHLIQQEVADIIRQTIQVSGIIISITKVRVTIDFQTAKIYMSIFPSDKKDALLQEVINLSSQIKHQLSLRVRYQLRKTPNLTFYIDDSLDYVEAIEKSLKGKDNPIQNT